ncbi:substrate-binding periplasmic protein [Zooshikella ganghwensis]|uniref:substrate-binding periplasmic protein n=1 Tax=Zooshikella ganghwensis TaxID=202772 RepID=UPI00041E39EE|nr:transporter substrate-binding domain-containing protein [Zooshikella ganghwensis]
MSFLPRLSLRASLLKYVSYLPLLCLATSYAKENRDFDYLLATDSWPPYYGEHLADGGFFSEVVRQAFKLQGKTVFIIYTSWKRAFELTKQGKYEGLLGAYYVPEREQYFIYSSAIIHSRQYLFSKKSSNIQFKTLKDLSPYRIGIVRGYHYSEEFDHADYLNKHEEVSAKKIIKLLLIDRVELIAADKRVMQFYVNRSYPILINQYKQHPLMLKDISVHLAISKKTPQAKHIHQTFEEGFALLKKQGLYQKILLRHGFPVED